MNPVPRPRPRVAGGTNPVLRAKPPRPMKAGAQAPGVVPPKLAAGAVGARKASLAARSRAAQTMKGAY